MGDPWLTSLQGRHCCAVAILQTNPDMIYALIPDQQMVRDCSVCARVELGSMAQAMHMNGSPCAQHSKLSLQIADLIRLYCCSQLIPAWPESEKAALHVLPCKSLQFTAG